MCSTLGLSALLWSFDPGHIVTSLSTDCSTYAWLVTEEMQAISPIWGTVVASVSPAGRAARMASGLVAYSRVDVRRARRSGKPGGQPGAAASSARRGRRNRRLGTRAVRSVTECSGAWSLGRCRSCDSTSSVGFVRDGSSSGVDNGSGPSRNGAAGLRSAPVPEPVEHAVRSRDCPAKWGLPRMGGLCGSCERIGPMRRHNYVARSIRGPGGAGRGGQCVTIM